LVKGGGTALSTEVIAILVTSLIEITYLSAILYRMYTKMNADDAALYLQGRKIEEVLKEMRGELARPR
jgi:hypothetical protein